MGKRIMEGMIKNRMKRVCWFVALTVTFAGSIIFGNLNATVTAQETKEGCSIIEMDLDKDGQKEVIMENNLLKLIFKPSDGGACVSLIYKKTGKELTYPEGGIFEDLIREEGNYGGAQLVNAKYDYKIEKRGPEEAKLHLWCEGKSQPLVWLEFHKTVTISKGKAIIRADYKIRNQTGSREPLTFSLRSHNVLFVNGEKNTYFIPTTDGIQTREYDPDNPPAVRDAFFPEPARGWSGVIGGDGTGLVCLMDYPYLKMLYNYFSPSPAFANIEWFYGPVTIDCGKEFATTYYLIPFSGLSSIDGATKDIIGSISAKDKYSKGETIPLKLGIYSVEGGALDLNLRYRILPEKKWQPISKRNIKVLPGRPVNLNIPFTPKGEGTIVINCQIEQSGKQMGEIEKPITIGKTTVVYKLEPIEKKKITIAKKTNYFPFKLSRKVITPHIKWASPYHKGKVKALFLMSAAEEREVIELAQRMDIDFRTSTIAEHNVHIGWAKPSIAFSKGYREVETLLNDTYDTIVISGCHQFKGSWKNRGWSLDWDDFIKSTQEKILEMVFEGTGLVYIHPLGLSGKMKELRESAKGIDKSHFLIAGIPLDLLPKFNKGHIKIAQYGKGRILFLNYMSIALTPFIDHYAVNFNYWEYYLSFLSKSLIWASKREPALLIKSITSSSAESLLKLENKGEEKEITIQFSIMDKKGREEEVLSRKLNLKTGINKLSFEIPFLKTGTHFANFILRDKENKVITWGSKPFKVESEIKIAQFILDKELYCVGDEVSARVKVINNSKKGEDISLSLSWVDNFGRLVKEEEKTFTLTPSSTSKIEVTFSLDQPFSILNYICCKLRAGDKTIQVKKRKFTISYNKGWDDYEVMMFSQDSAIWFPGYVTAEHYNRLKELGVTTLFFHASRSMYDIFGLALESNLRIMPGNITRFHLGAAALEKAKKTLVRLPCLSDPEYLKGLKDSLSREVKGLKKYSPVAYHIGDEMSLTSYTTPADICFSEHCLKNFRRWLKDEYKNLEALNKEWDTSFKDWEEVKPMTTKEVEARGTGNFSPWADHRNFMDTVFASTLNLCKEAICELEPGVPVGASGIQRPCAYGGYNWWKLMKVFTFVQAYFYTGNQGEIQRSFSPDTPISSCLGYRSTAAGLQYELWDTLFHGNSGTTLWYSPYFLNPDLTPTELGYAVKKYIKEEIRKGVGKLIMNCERLNDDGIAIHYSQASVQASYISKIILGYDTEKEYGSNMDSLLKLLEDLHLQYNFVSYEQIEEGELLKKGYKTLILPLSRAISRKEIKQIKNFVKKGGVVIGDLQTAIMDGHCKSEKEGLLNEVFGIRREETKLTSRLSSLKFKDQSVRVSGFERIAPLPSSRATGKVGKYPAVIKNAYGKGKAVYLNFPFEYYLLAKRREKERELFKDILKKAGIESEVRIRDKDKKDIPCEVVFLKNGENRYVGIVQHPGLVKGLDIRKAKPWDIEAKQVSAAISLPYKTHIYDVREGRYYGLTDKIKTKIIPSVAKFYALLPYKVKGLKLMVDNHFYAQGHIVNYKIEVKTSTDKAGTHIVRLEVYNPEGKLSEPYSRNILIKDGLFEGRIPLALNEAKGTWKIHIKEVVSGNEMKEEFIVN